MSVKKKMILILEWDNKEVRVRSQGMSSSYTIAHEAEVVPGMDAVFQDFVDGLVERSII